MIKPGSPEYWIDVEKTARERLSDLRIMLNSLDVQRAERAQEILQLEQLIKSIAPFTAESPMDAIDRICRAPIAPYVGLTLAGACRKVLKDNDSYLTPIEVRDSLLAGGYGLTQYPNPLASIHGVLKRMAESGEALSLANAAGNTVYKWNPASDLLKKKANGKRKRGLHRRTGGVTTLDMSKIIEGIKKDTLVVENPPYLDSFSGAGMTMKKKDEK